jgi:hypothetical protein
VGRHPRSDAAADASVKLRLTADEHARYSAAALAAGYQMPRTAEHPEPRGAVGAWMRSLAEAATASTPGAWT